MKTISVQTREGIRCLHTPFFSAANIAIEAN